MPADRSGPRRRKGPFILILALLFLASFFLLVILPNPLLDSAASRLCTEWFKRPVELRGVHVRFTGGKEIHFSIDEIDLRKALREEASAAGRFVQAHDISPWLIIKDSHWVFKSARGASYLRLLGARSQDAFMRGGLRSDDGRVLRWNTALRLPRSLWGRFPQLVGKRFGRDLGGRCILKMTYSNGHFRLWGRSGPALEASWQ